MAAAWMPLHGQELPPVTDGRVDGMVSSGLNDAILVERDPLMGEVRGGGWNLGVILAAAYDDNISLSRTNPESDVVIEAVPVIEYAKGSREGWDGGYVRFAYRPTSVVYLQKNADNRIDHEAAVSAAWRGKSTGVEYEGTFRRQGDATADVGRQTDRTELEHVVRVAWMPREKVTATLGAGHSLSDYDERALLDSKEVFGEAALRYAYSPKTTLEAKCRAGRFQVDGAADQKIHRVTAGVDWQPREKVRIQLEGGGEYRSHANGSDVNPVVEGRVEWTPKEGTNLYLAGYRREMASAFHAGQNYRVTGATAGLAQRLGGKWTARLEGGLERAGYRQVDGAGGGGRNDRLWFVRPALEYRFTENFGMELFHRVADSSSNRAGFGYEQHVSGVRLDYQF